MSAGAILTMAVAAVMGARPPCDPAPATAGLAAGACALEAVPEGVRVRGCAAGDGTPPPEWTIAAPPVDVVVAGTGGGMLEEATVNVALSAGGTLWLGLSERDGCRRRPRGLVRYDWKRDAANAFRGTDTGPCGFDVQDLLLRGDTLWVATDLGVSRIRVSPDEWDEWAHYAPSTDGGTLEEATCYSLLSLVAEAAAAPGGEELGRRLAEFRPKFTRRLRRGTRPASPGVRRRNEQTLGHPGRAGTGSGRVGPGR
jgi:hypothetical protein